MILANAGVVPQGIAAMSVGHEQAILDLAGSNKIISVRVAMFADMMKSQSWIAANLKDLGGVGGVGVTFLEQTFIAKTAPSLHRVHQKAAQCVLRALLPEAGTNIKGSTQSLDQLREAAGYMEKPEQFDELIRILDGDVRLITPTDPRDAGSAPNKVLGDKYWMRCKNAPQHRRRTGSPPAQ